MSMAEVCVESNPDIDKMQVVFGMSEHSVLVAFDMHDNCENTNQSAFVNTIDSSRMEKLHIDVSGMMVQGCGYTDDLGTLQVLTGTNSEPLLILTADHNQQPKTSVLHTSHRPGDNIIAPNDLFFKMLTQSFLVVMYQQAV